MYVKLEVRKRTLNYCIFALKRGYSVFPSPMSKGCSTPRGSRQYTLIIIIIIIFFVRKKNYCPASNDSVN